MDGDGRQPDAALLAACQPELRQAFHLGQGAHGRFDVDLDGFGRHFVQLTLQRLLAAGSRCDEATVRDTLRTAAGADVYLAWACERGDGAAWGATMRLRPRILGIVVKRGASAAEAEGIVDALWGQLALEPRHGRTRTGIGTYNGTGSLFYWLRGVAVRRWVDTLRARRRLEPLPEDDELAPQAPQAAVAAGRAEADETVRRALRALAKARETLTANELLCLVCKYGRGMPQKAIADLLHLSASRIVRIMQAMQAKLEAALRAEFGEDLDLEVLAEALRQWLTTLDSDPPRPADRDDPEATVP